MNAWLSSVAALIAPLSSISPAYPSPQASALKEQLTSPSNAQNVRRNFDYLQDLLHEADLPEIGVSLGSPIDYCQWLFRRLMSNTAAPALKVRLLSQLERLFVGQDATTLDTFAPLVLVNFIPLLEAPQPPAFLEAAIGVMSIIATRLPDRFAVHLADFADILFGWRMQPSALPPSLRRALDAFLRSLGRLWSRHARLTFDLVAKLTADLATAPPSTARALLACASPIVCALSTAQPTAANLLKAACTQLGPALGDAQEETDTYEALRRVAALVPLPERSGPLLSLLCSSALRAPITGPPLAPSSIVLTLTFLTSLLPMLDASQLALLLQASATPLASSLPSTASPLALLRYHSQPSVLQALAALMHALALHHPPFLTAIVASINATIVASPFPSASLPAITFDALVACRALSRDALLLHAPKWLAIVAQQPTQLASLGTALLAIASPLFLTHDFTTLLMSLLSRSVPPPLLASALRAVQKLPPPLPSALLAAVRALLYVPELEAVHDIASAVLLQHADSAGIGALLWRWASVSPPVPTTTTQQSSLPVSTSTAYRLSPVFTCAEVESPQPLLPDATEHASAPPSDWLPRFLAAVSPSASPDLQDALFTLAPPPPVSPHEWLAESIAAHAVASRLRSVLGGPAQTLEAIEKSVLEQAKRVATEGGRRCSRAPTLLLSLADRLDRALYIASEGAVTATPPPRPVAAFFRANKRVCDEWIARLRPPLVPLARHAGSPYDLAAHAYARLTALLARPSRDAAEPVRTLYFIAEALIEAGHADAVTGLADWAPIEGTQAWLSALADEAHGRCERAIAALQTLLLAPSPSAALVAVAPLLAGRVDSLISVLGEQASSLASWSADSAALRPLAPLGPRAALLALASARRTPSATTTLPIEQHTLLETELRLLISSRAPLTSIVPAIRLLSTATSSTSLFPPVTAAPTATSPPSSALSLSAIAPPASSLSCLSASVPVNSALLQSHPLSRAAALLLARRHARLGNARTTLHWLNAARMMPASGADDALDEARTAALLAPSPSDAVLLLLPSLGTQPSAFKAHLRLARLFLSPVAPATPPNLASLTLSAPLIFPSAPRPFAAGGAELLAAQTCEAPAEAKQKLHRRLAMWAFSVPAVNIAAFTAALQTPSTAEGLPWSSFSQQSLAVLRQYTHEPLAQGLVHRTAEEQSAAIERDALKEGVAANEARLLVSAWQQWSDAYISGPYMIAATSAAYVLRSSSSAPSDWPIALRLLRLIQADLPSLRSLYSDLSSLPASVWLSLLPQLFATLKNSSTREPVAALVQHWLVSVGQYAPHFVLFPVLAGGAPLAALEAQLRTEHGAKVTEAAVVRQELARVAVLDEERWLLELSRVQSLLTAGRLPARLIAGRLARLVDSAETTDAPLAPHSRAFRQQLHGPLLRALEVLRASEATGEEAWSAAGLKALQHTLLARVHAWAGRLPLLLLSPRLAALRSSSLCFPSLQAAVPAAVTVVTFGAEVQLLPTKTRPKRITVHSTDGALHAFLLKGRDELAIDQRMLQFLHLSNLLFAEPSTARHASPPLHARTYAVTPLAPRVGLIEMVPHCVSLFAVYRHWRRRKAHHEPVRPAEEFHARLLPLLRERGVALAGTARSAWPLDLLLRLYEQLRATVPSDLLARELQCAAASPRAWLSAVSSFSRSAGTMSALGYVAGLGDRHADNILVDLHAGAVLHIDHNVCLDAGLRLRVPELVPFRLTHTLERAMGVSGVHGEFTESACYALSILRTHRASIVMLFDSLRDEPHLDWGAARADAARASAERAVSLGLIAARLADQRPALAAALSRHTQALYASAALLRNSAPLYGPAAAEAQQLEALARLEQRAINRAQEAEEALRAAMQESERLSSELETLRRDEIACRNAVADAATKCAKWQERHEAAVARFSALQVTTLRSESVRRALDAYQRAVLSRAPPDWTSHNRHAEWHALFTELLRAPSVSLLDALQAQLSPSPTGLTVRDAEEEEEARRDLLRAQTRVGEAWRALCATAKRPKGPWALMALQTVLCSGSNAGSSLSPDTTDSVLHTVAQISLLQPSLDPALATVTALSEASSALAAQSELLLSALAAETARAVASADATVPAAINQLQHLASAATAMSAEEAQRAWRALSTHNAAAGGALLVAAHAALLTRPETPLLPFLDASSVSSLAPLRLQTVSALLQLFASPIAPTLAATAAHLGAYQRGVAANALSPVLHAVREHLAAQWLDEQTPAEDQAAAEVFAAASVAHMEALLELTRAQGRVQAMDDERREQERCAALQPGAVRDGLLTELNAVQDEPEGKGLRALLDFEAHRFASEPRAATLDTANISLLQHYRRALAASEELALAAQRASTRAAALQAEMREAKAQQNAAQSDASVARSGGAVQRWAEATKDLAAYVSEVQQPVLPTEVETSLEALENIGRGVSALTSLDGAARAVRAQLSAVTLLLSPLTETLSALTRFGFPVPTIAPLAARIVALCPELESLHALLASTAQLCVQQVGAVPAVLADASEAEEEEALEGEEESGDDSAGDEALSGTAFSVDTEVERVVEAEEEKRRQDQVLQRVRNKLEGLDAIWCNTEGGQVLEVRAQVKALIKQASAPTNLAAMYEGWAAWI